MAEVRDVVKGLKKVLGRVEAACQRRPPEHQHTKPRLVAVSKTKPAELVMAAYDSGQRHFGENYSQELIGKAHEVQARCPEICWHYIGHLQRNKVGKLVGVPGLWTVETVDSARLASALQDAVAKLARNLQVMVQVNTSGEESKGGCEPAEAPVLVEHVVSKCPNLTFQGLMTIGRFDHDPAQGTNPDFECLLGVRERVCEALGLQREAVELSMGMSHDYELAICSGSTNVRVGSAIFGARSKKAPPSEPAA